MSGDTHQLQWIKLHHLKLETSKSIRWFRGNWLNKLNFRLNSQCNRRMTWSPKSADSTNQRRSTTYAWRSPCLLTTARDSKNTNYAAFLCHHKHNLPSKLRLPNNQTTCGCNNYDHSERAIFTFPTVDVCWARWPGLSDTCQRGKMATLLNSWLFVFRISFLPIHRVKYPSS